LDAPSDIVRIHPHCNTNPSSLQFHNSNCFVRCHGHVHHFGTTMSVSVDHRGFTDYHIGTHPLSYSMILPWNGVSV
jgi:hypothetical protein